VKIERFRDKKNRIKNRAMSKSGKTLFSHCSNGSDEVSTKVLNAVVVPMLFVHGVSAVEIVDNA